MVGSVVEGPDDSHSHSCPLHPVPNGTEVLLLSVDCQHFQAEEYLTNIKAKDILVNGLSKSMSATPRCVTYSILKGHTWC